MCNNNCGGNICWIIILILLFCNCGGGNMWGGNGCGNNCGCDNNCGSHEHTCGDHGCH